MLHNRLVFRQDKISLPNKSWINKYPSKKKRTAVNVAVLQNTVISSYKDLRSYWDSKAEHSVKTNRFSKNIHSTLNSHRS